MRDMTKDEEREFQSWNQRAREYFTEIPSLRKAKNYKAILHCIYEVNECMAAMEEVIESLND